MTQTKEQAYDDYISPLIAKVINLCYKHKINAAMQFALDFDDEHDGPLYCTTVLEADTQDADGLEHIRDLCRVMHPPAPTVMALTVQRNNKP